MSGGVGSTKPLESGGAGSAGAGAGTARGAVVGLGKMGVPIAERIVDAGHSLAVWNRTRSRTAALGSRGATVLDSPADALAGADVCVTMLADDAALEAVAPEVLAGARPGTALVDTSTVSVSASERVAEARVDFLRSPLTGYKGEALLRDDDSATFTTAMMLEDVDLVLDLAEERRLVLPFARHLRQLLERTIAAGHADEDFMALYLQLREAAARESTPTRAAERR